MRKRERDGRKRENRDVETGCFSYERTRVAAFSLLSLPSITLCERVMRSSILVRIIAPSYYRGYYRDALNFTIRSPGCGGRTRPKKGFTFA